MNKSGRLALVKSVLCATPIHQLLVFVPPKKIIKQLEKIRRGFLWEARAAANEGNCHVNWRRVCRALSLGSLGVQDIERAGLALRLRCQWFSRTDAGRAWARPRPEVLGGGALNFLCVHQHDHCQTALFWEDRWIEGKSVNEIAPKLYVYIPKRR